MRQQREKREVQRQKKMAATSKLGMCSVQCLKGLTIYIVLLCHVGVASSRVDVEINEGVESEELTTPLSHAQYSPSVSHDEEDRGNRENRE